MPDNYRNLSRDGTFHVVLDTSLLAGAIIYNTTPDSRILEFVFERDILAHVTIAMINEHRNMFAKESTKNGVPITDLHRQLLETFISVAELTQTADVPIKYLAGAVAKSDIQTQDWKFLIAVAIVSARLGCCYLVSNDRDLTNLEKPLIKLNIYILNSSNFMEVLS